MKNVRLKRIVDRASDDMQNVIIDLISEIESNEDEISNLEDRIISLEDVIYNLNLEMSTLKSK